MQLLETIRQCEPRLCSNSFVINRKASSMRKSECRAKLVCSNYAMKKALKHLDNYFDNYDDLDDHKYHLDTGLKYCSLAIKINPQNAYAYLTRGSVYTLKEQFKRAFRDLNKALRLGSNDGDVYYELGFAHLLCNEFREAINNFSKALLVNPERWASWYFRGCAFSDMELYEKAIPDLKLAISLGTDDKDYDETLSRLNKAYLGRGQQHLNACRNLEAIDDFTKAASSKNLIVKAYEGRATAFTNLGKMEEAKADIAKANYIREEQEHAKKNSHD